MPEARFTYNRVRAVLELGGVRVPLINAIANWPLNGIPNATASIAIGRSTETGLAAAIHHASIATSLREMVPAKIYATIEVATTDDGIRVLVPDEPFLFFDGLVSGVATSTGGAADVTLSLVHWLALLAEGSAFSRSSHPSNPADYSFGALMPTDDTGFKTRDLSDLSQPRAFVTADTLGRDFWGEALLPWFKKMAERDGLQVRERNIRPSGTADRVLSALNRMSPESVFGRKLALSVPPDVDLAASIAEDVARATSDASFFGNQTFWDVLVGNFAPSYGFAVVPRPDDALVVPYIAGYAGPEKPTSDRDAEAVDGKVEYLPTIRAGEYNAGRFTDSLKRTLKAVGIRTGISTLAGANLAAGPSRLGMGGYYDSEREGLTMITHGPPWMTRLTVSDQMAAKAAAGAGGEPKSTAMRPRAGKKGNKAEEVAKRQDDVVKPMLEAYAKARFADEVFKGRQLPIAGPFRWDISPGSLVAVEGMTELFTRGDAFDTTYYGTVAQVTHSLMCDQADAGTGFHLVSVRYADENANSKISIPGHPFYKETFSAASMRG